MRDRPPGATAEQHQQLERAIVQLASRDSLPIPPYPAVALRVQQAVARQDFGLAEVSRLVSADASLAADVLRCANSALYDRGAHVSNLTQAITRVGAQQVMRLALSSGLAANAQAPGPLAALRRLIWVENLAAAAICQELARLRSLRMEEAFVLGLLHDFGKVIAASCLEALEKIQGGAPRPLDAWLDLADRQHVRLGQAMAERWGLPPLVREVIAAHHGTGGEACRDPGLLAVVKAADEVVALLGRSPHVTMGELARSAPLVAAGERDAVARVVERIPGFVVAFEAAGASSGTPRSLVAAPDSKPPEGERAVSFGVTVTVARRVRAYAAESIAPNALVMRGNEPLAENRLVEVAIQGEDGRDPLVAWALVRQSVPEQDGHRVELQPYALSRDARDRWEELLESGVAPGG